MLNCINCLDFIWWWNCQIMISDNIVFGHHWLLFATEIYELNFCFLIFPSASFFKCSMCNKCRFSGAKLLENSFWSCFFLHISLVSFEFSWKFSHTHTHTRWYNRMIKRKITERLICRMPNRINSIFKILYLFCHWVLLLMTRVSMDIAIV